MKFGNRIAQAMRFFRARRKQQTKRSEGQSGPKRENRTSPVRNCAVCHNTHGLFENTPKIAPARDAKPDPGGRQLSPAAGKQLA
ncbi:hypothetical protein P6U16_20480 [Rhizobium sp. 32-5/1]|uniref:hypothetical protein n=1 Tax=Rhizobium sp. 32-5/1 TaxID=3019602 RepID=UPI00240E5494|nr:hypothetical protein [Rhizobium sp. 32-5/1]WEZ83206.1 hypothetical protein P6U16_20480 [Rhizobium sp. 32-5/1]